MVLGAITSAGTSMKGVEHSDIGNGNTQSYANRRFPNSYGRNVRVLRRAGLNRLSRAHSGIAKTLAACVVRDHGLNLSISLNPGEEIKMRLT